MTPVELTSVGETPDPDRTPKYDASDLALNRARRFMRRLKHQPFVAMVIDEGSDRVNIYHTTGINLEQIQAIREMLDELEERLHS